MRHRLLAPALGALLALALSAGFASAAQGTSCRPGDTLLYIGPGSAMGYLSKYDHNGDTYVCETSTGKYYDNHF